MGALLCASDSVVFSLVQVTQKEREEKNHTSGKALNAKQQTHRNKNRGQGPSFQAGPSMGGGNQGRCFIEIPCGLWGAMCPYHHLLPASPPLLPHKRIS